MDRISNTQIYILTKLNELASRHGLHPCLLDATIDDHGILKFHSVPSDPDQAEKLETVKKAIKCTGWSMDLGDEMDFVEGLDRALHNAPRPRHL